ncbi:hypothetical protein QYF36_012539 [Acer negundo]|nr:hypothetical protein QYF36_012539 [Acer negundo]
MDGEENSTLTWNENEMDVEENLELTWDDAQMDEEENLGLSWSKNWEDIPETQDQSFEDFLVIGKDKGVWRQCILKFMNNSVENQKVRNELIQQASTNEKCRDIIRMSPLALARLCELLRDTGRHKDNKNAIV